MLGVAVSTTQDARITCEAGLCADASIVKYFEQLVGAVGLCDAVRMPDWLSAFPTVETKLRKMGLGSVAQLDVCANAVAAESRCFLSLDCWRLMLALAISVQRTSSVSADVCQVDGAADAPTTGLAGEREPANVAGFSTSKFYVAPGCSRAAGGAGTAQHDIRSRNK